MNRAVLAWCRCYTAAVPDEVRERRREEIAAHVQDARAAGRRGRDVALDAIRGAVDDLRWCGEERRRAGLAPAAFGTAGSSAIALVLIAVSYVLELDPTERFEWAGDRLAEVAALVVVLSLVDRAHRRFARRRG